MALHGHYLLTMPQQGLGARGKSSALCPTTNALRSLQPTHAAILQKFRCRRCQESLLPPQAITPAFGELPAPPAFMIACSMSPIPLPCVPFPGAVVVIIHCSSCPLLLSSLQCCVLLAWFLGDHDLYFFPVITSLHTELWYKMGAQVSLKQQQNFLFLFFRARGYTTTLHNFGKNTC